LALFAATVLINRASALWTISAPTGQMTLDINAGTLSCTYENDLYVWSGASSYSQHDEESTFTGYFECIDLNWTLTSWNLAAQSNTLVNQANTSKTMGQSLIWFKSAPTRTVDWTCGTPQGTITYANFTTPRIIMGKLYDKWAVCTLQTTGNMIKVQIPANQAVGNYLSTLSFTLSEFS